MMRIAARYIFFVMVIAFSFSIFTAVAPSSQNLDIIQTTHAQDAPSPSDSSDEDGDPTDPAFCKGKTPNIGWIVCPFNAAVVFTVESLDKMINRLLTVDPDQLFNTEDSKSSGARYKQAWSVFRSIALGIVVIAALVIIISTAFGYEIFDAYTIRKLLPRTLIAILGITLSWNILEFLILFTNDVGNGIRAVIYLPFQGMDRIDFGLASGAGVGLLSGGLMIALGGLGFLTLIVTAALAVLIAFLVLTLREIVIIALVLFAPIGIACLILPGTRKGWQLWQNSLTVMLVVFPIISAFIATGRVFSLVVSNGDQGGDVVNKLIAFAAYILPYFMLPFAFRMAGGVMATLGGFANDSSRGVFDRMKNYRGQKSQENFAKMKAGNRFANRNVAARTFNKATSSVGMGVQGNFGMGERGRQARSQLEEIAALEQVQKNPKWAGVHQNDDALMALTYSNAAEAKKELYNRWNKPKENASAEERAQVAELASARADRAVNAAQASVKFGRSQQIAAARQLVSTGTGYDNIEDMTEVLGRASGGNMNTAAALAGFANSETKKTGRGDLAPSFGTLENMVQHAGDTGKPGLKPVNENEYMQNAWESVSLYQHGNGKPTAIKNFAKHYEDRLANGTHEQKIQAATFFKDLQNMKSGANGAVSGEISRILDRNQRDIADVSSQIPPVASRPGSGGAEVINNTNRDGSPMTIGDHAAQRARSYRDPNNADRD